MSFWNNPEFQEKIYNFFYNLFRFESSLKILPVDLDKPWYQIILDQKWIFLLEIISEAVQAVYGALTPLILGYTLFNQSLSTLFWFVFGYALLEIMNRFVLRFQTIMTYQTSNSIAFAAYSFFLTVDPIFHTNKSSGQIFGKIQSTTASISELLSQFVSGLVPLITGFVTVVIALGSYSWTLAVTSISFFVLITLTNGTFNLVNARTFKPRMIKQEDKTNGLLVENLFQNALIRSSFATPERLKRTKKLLLDNMVITATRDLSVGVGTTMTRILYIIGTFAIAFILLNLLKKGELSTNLAVTLMITYINSSSPVMRFGQTIRQFVDKYVQATDLFTFIQKFGKQSFPVLEGEEKLA